MSTLPTQVPVRHKHTLQGFITVEPHHVEAFRLFTWYGKPPFFDAPRAHISFSNLERERRVNSGLGSVQTYSFSPARLAWMLEYGGAGMEKILKEWHEGGPASRLISELKRPFRMLYRTSNKLNVTLKNIKCPAVAEREFIVQ